MDDSFPGRRTGQKLPSGRRHSPYLISSWIWRVLYILYSLEVGVLLLFLPWLGIWDNNYLLYRFPQFRTILANPFLKGAVLGLGIVNILIGIEEIANFRKYRKGSPSD